MNKDGGDQAEQYRVGPTIRFRFGTGQELLHFPLVGAHRRYSPLMADAIAKWTSFRSVDEAVSEIVAGRPSLSTESLRQAVEDLIDADCLIARSTLFNPLLVAQTASAQAEASKIDYLAIPTADRADLAERALRSYSQNMRSFDRACEIFISDDSRRNDESEQLLRAIASFEPGANISVSYAGIVEKQRFSECLGRSKDIPPEVINFALFGSGLAMETPGANRNAILFHTCGSMLLSIDDDTICAPRQADETTEKLALMAHRSPAEIWPFTDPLKTLSFGNDKVLDVVGEHEKFLGRSISTVISEAHQNSLEISLDEMCGHILSSLLSDGGQIRATYNGARGDSGFHSNLGLLTHQSAMTRGRVQEPAVEYQSKLCSRQIARQSLHPAIAHADSAAIGMCVGLDNRGSLPPFMPDGRNEDGVFAAVLGRSSDHNYVAHLPFTIAHEPHCRKTIVSDIGMSPRFSDLLLSLCSNWKPSPGPRNQPHIIRELGRHLTDIGALPHSDFDDLARILMCNRIASIIGSVEGILAEDGYQPSHWAEDLENRIGAMQRASDHSEFFVPVDLPPSANIAPRRQAQQLVARYGQLLDWWPLLTQRAVELKGARYYLGSRALRFFE